MRYWTQWRLAREAAYLQEQLKDIRGDRAEENPWGVSNAWLNYAKEGIARIIATEVADGSGVGGRDKTSAHKAADIAAYLIANFPLNASWSDRPVDEEPVDEEPKKKTTKKKTTKKK